MLNAASAAAGEPIFGVYPEKSGREPSFPNPSANLVSTRKEARIARLIQPEGCLLAFFVLPETAAFLIFGIKCRKEI